MKGRTARAIPSDEEVWRTYDAVESRLTAPLSERMLDLAGLQPGMQLLDLATGRGEPALRAARRVGARGRVVGIDTSASMLRMAQERADAEGLSNLELRVGDAGRLDGVVPGSFHAATIRWGLMYMATPVVVLEKVRRALRPDAALVAALWAEPERTPYATLPRQLIERYMSLPARDPEAPGVHRFADPERIDRDFALAGLRVEHVEEMQIPVFEAQTPEEVVAWTRAVGMARLLNELSEADEKAWEADMRGALQPDVDGWFRVGGVTRIVRALPSSR